MSRGKPQFRSLHLGWRSDYQMTGGFPLLEGGGAVGLDLFPSYCEDELGIATFSGNCAGMKTDVGSAHGHVCNDDGHVVRMWDQARREVELCFQA